MVKRKQGFNHNRHKSVARYPWDKWLTRKETRIEKGVDFVCALHGMLTMIRNAASNRRLRVSLSTSQERYIIIRVRGPIE